VKLSPPASPSAGLVTRALGRSGVFLGSPDLGPAVGVLAGARVVTPVVLGPDLNRTDPRGDNKLQYMPEKRAVSPRVIPLKYVLEVDVIAPTTWKLGHLRIITHNVGRGGRRLQPGPRG
jgi:hypothetical protein